MRISREHKDIPNKWYNIIPDLSFAMTPMMGSSGYPLSHHDLESLMAAPTIEQELEKNRRDISIPEEVLRLYSRWRPTPLYRAERFEKRLGTQARIFYKYEGATHPEAMK